MTTQGKYKTLLNSIVNSYSQIFFSKNRSFAIILIIASFLDYFSGLCGLIAVLSSNIIAYFVGFNKHNIKCGYYGFNSLLVGLGIGIYYSPSFEIIILLLFASLLTLFLSLLMEGVIGKYGLPYLSIPFLISIWMIALASREFKAIELSSRGLFRLNEVYSIGGMSFIKYYNFFNNINIHESVITYFKSLGAIFFEYNILGGVLIAIGLLIYSRIAFLLSIVSFISAYIYYKFIGANINELTYSFIGYNYILTSIAIGGYFIIPSKYSFLWVILLTPLISIIITSTNIIFSIFQLSIYSLPFNFIVLLFLYVLKFRERHFNKPELVLYQFDSPENNLYSQLNNKIRFKNTYNFPISLPFWGEWIVSQGHDGNITHKEDWKFAFDFVLVDKNNKTYKYPGNKTEDFYAYNKPVLAPANGTIEEIADNIEDNKIGEINIRENWGNTIIIKHADYLYSKLSHLKKGSFKVAKGDAVKKGDILAYCGNSGRSPEPHVHFQIQASPYIGSKTLNYPIDNYIVRNNNSYNFKSSNIPFKDEAISNIEKNTILNGAFNFIAGQKFNIIVTSKSSKQIDNLVWEVKTDIYNNSFIYCKITDSKAYFYNDGKIHYFTNFIGDKKSILFYFYQAAYKVLLGFYKNLELNDSFSLHNYNKIFLMILQDFIAPFHIFIHHDFSLIYKHIDNELSTNNIIIKSKSVKKIGKNNTLQTNFKIYINSKGIAKFLIKEGRKISEVTWLQE